ncbi:HNH endonuclease signature motif containing protein [Paractinoplanes atraurantiacus]|uniref:HNH endonuclease n=1 Tax=Paractinoplanes atraurantiacus TaxID=1036182 RepID=A0A285IDR6_9ACTN|nr:HNH endonuclease signature motif containing protein [Actinoplanes atraurantiacus]SNY46092.1 HNH endonuclease [Actinoplanes atraurantiacus]
MLADLQHLNQDAAELATAPLWPLPDGEITDSLVTVHRCGQVLAVLLAQLAHQATTRGLPRAQGHATTARWLRELLHIDPAPAKETAERGALLARHPTLEQAVLDGRIDLRHAGVIASTVESIPETLADFDDVGLAEAAELAEKAQDTMIGMAARLAAFQLRKAGDRILAHVAPHLADQAEEARLARQEARAHRRRGFTLSLPVDGVVRLSGQLDTESAAILQAALHPLCKPITGDDRTPAQRRADALVDICKLALRTTELPEDGGEPPQVAVTIPYQPLTRTLGTATTDTGERLSATTARRMACDARLLPVVLGGEGQVLDLGRTRRLASGSLRRALHIRDRGCAFPSCDRPPRWTDCHHLVGWNDGGPTSLDNLVLLCRRHHRLVHHPTMGWQIRLGPDGHPDFIPPPTIDPDRRPRRNQFHHRPQEAPAAGPSPAAVELLEGSAPPKSPTPMPR